MAVILVVDDEKPLRELVRAYLEHESYQVVEAATGDEALQAFATHRPDVLVLDLMLPGVDGIEICRRVRAQSDAYIIMLTARADEVDRVVGLEVGADDYLTKPFSPRELVARVRACLRRPRLGSVAAVETTVLRFEALAIDVDGHSVTLDGEPIALTTTECRLIHIRASAPGRLFTRSQLLEQVWGMNYYGDDHVVDVHIANARRKLKEDPAAPRYIETVRGAGYRWRHA